MSTRLRAWSRRPFYDPEPVLRNLRRVEIALLETETPDLIRRLRTNRLKTEREARDALIFAHGMASVLGVKVFVAPGETEDCDFITRARVGDTYHFCCVQLKELAPEDRNPSQTLASPLDGLQGLPPSDAVLAIHLNRRTRIQSADLAAARAPFAELWFFWTPDPEVNSWRLFGNTMATALSYEFEYP